MIGYYLIAGIIFLVSWYVSSQLKSKFKKYSKIHLQNGMSGKEIAEKMLADNGIHDVKVISVPGQLTDHYDPTKKTVNLSEPVYMQRNAAASAVGTWIFGVGIALFAITTAFAFITLPVEFDASKRALVWLETNNMVTQQEHDGAKDALKWAARTYVVAALGSLATLLYFISIFLGRD